MTDLLHVPSGGEAWWPADVRVHTTLATTRALIGLRRQYGALRHGCLRWAYASDETIAYPRETPRIASSSWPGGRGMSPRTSLCGRRIGPTSTAAPA
jgi:hypothetical protein